MPLAWTDTRAGMRRTRTPAYHPGWHEPLNGAAAGRHAAALAGQATTADRPRDRITAPHRHAPHPRIRVRRTPHTGPPPLTREFAAPRPFVRDAFRKRHPCAWRHVPEQTPHGRRGHPPAPPGVVGLVREDATGGGGDGVRLRPGRPRTRGRDPGPGRTSGTGADLTAHANRRRPAAVRPARRQPRRAPRRRRPATSRDDPLDDRRVRALPRRGARFTWSGRVHPSPPQPGTTLGAPNETHRGTELPDQGPTRGDRSERNPIPRSGNRSSDSLSSKPRTPPRKPPTATTPTDYIDAWLAQHPERIAETRRHHTRRGAEGYPSPTTPGNPGPR